MANRDFIDENVRTMPWLPVHEGASYRIIEKVRRKISTQYVRASDSAVAKVLGLSRGAVHGYKRQRDVMSQERFLEINRMFLHLPDDQVLELLTELQRDAATSKELGDYWQRVSDRVRRATVILIAVLGVGSAAIPEVSRAASVDRFIHYAKRRRLAGAAA